MTERAESFSDSMSRLQVEWRRNNVRCQEHGTWRGEAYEWILPRDAWEEGLWPGIRNVGPNSVAQYLKSEKAEKHTGSNNLKSSWVACANLYFPFRQRPEDLALLAGFLRKFVAPEIRTVDRLELEYAEDGALHPARLLGERGGSRGKGQTSPDVAFLVNGEKGIVLTECKLTEDSFGKCSARRREDKGDRPGNPDPDRCSNAAAVVSEPEKLCHQVVWGRRHWNLLKPVMNRDAVASLKACPAATVYQLFRQQALAEGYASQYELAVSAVAYDQRNDDLISSVRRAGVESFPEGWARLFSGRARFRAWSHQSWYDWVRQHEPIRWRDWLDWIGARYGYVTGGPKA